MKRNHFLFCVLWLLLGASCTETSTKRGGKPILEVGYQNSPIATLLMVAKDKGYFDTVGLQVNMHSYTAGKFAVTDLTSGKGLDVALSGELPLVYAALQGNQVRIFSQVVERTSNECRIIARSSGKAQTPEQYFSVPRTIATSKKGTPEYFLHEYIKKHKLDTSKLTIVGMKPEDMTPALVNKSTDAICIFDPVASLATRAMKSDGLVFQDADMYSALYIVSVMEPTLNTRKADLVNFINALDRAAVYCQSNPAEAKRIVARYTKLDADIIDSLWPNYTFGIALTDKLPRYLHDEAIWAKQSGDTMFRSAIPDFTKAVIDTTVLHSATPQKVRL